MNLYLDQMCRIEVADTLREHGFKVLRAKEIGHDRASDQEILDFTINHNLILVTLDDHFGDWTVLPLRKHPGVIRLKVHPTTPEKILELLLPFLKAKHHFPYQNHLIIVVPNLFGG